MLWSGAVAIVYLERLFDTRFCCTTGELINTLEGHTSEVTAVAVAPDGETIVTGDRRHDGACVESLDRCVVVGRMRAPGRGQRERVRGSAWAADRADGRLGRGMTRR